MQVATASRPSGGIPASGDGFTYEHLAGRSDLWVDFIADTGDGGDPTYSVARALAAPSLSVALPSAGDARMAGTVPRVARSSAPTQVGTNG
jgi:hypothetical protein